MQAKSGCENGGNSTAQQAKGVTNEGSHTLLTEEIELWWPYQIKEKLTGDRTLTLPGLVNAFEECLCVHLGMSLS